MKKLTILFLCFILIFSQLSAQINFNEINAPNSDRSIRTMVDKGNVIEAVAISPNGKYIASGSVDIKIWDVATGALLQTLVGHTMSISYLTFSHDGKYLASASYDNTIKLWDIPGGQCVRTFTGHSWIVFAVAFNFNDNYLISCGTTMEATPELKVWDASGNLRSDLKGHHKDVRAVAFSPNDDRIASGSLDSTVRIWDASTGQTIQTLKGAKGSVCSIAFTPDGKYILAGSKDKVIRRWNTGTWKNTFMYQTPAPVNMLKISRNGKFMAVVCQDCVVRLWNLETGEYLRTFQGHKGEVKAVDFTADSKFIVSAAADGTIKLWDIAKSIE